MKRLMRSNLAWLFWLIILTFAVFYPLKNNIAKAEEQPKGNISFSPNVIPDLTITARVGRNNESFRLAWLNNTFDLELFFNATYLRKDENITNLFSLRDFEDDFNVTVDYQFKRNESNIQFGWVIDNVENVSNFVDSAWFKIENSSFDYEKIILETKRIDENDSVTIFLFPDNLRLTFHDLRDKGFIIGWQNKTSTSVKGFSGKSNWNLDPVTMSGDVIIVNNYTSSTPASFQDIYDADLSGNVLLKDNATQGQDQSLDTEVRPADSGALQIRFEVITYSPPKGDIFVNGTDFYDNDITETFEVDAVGNYTTTNYYKTVVEVDVDPDITVDIWQDRWGVISFREEQVFLETIIEFGDGSALTYFKETNKQVVFDAYWGATFYDIFKILNNASVQMGEVETGVTDLPSSGVDFIDTDSSDTVFFLNVRQGGNLTWSFGSWNFIEGMARFINIVVDTYCYLYHTRIQGIGVSGVWQEIHHVTLVNPLATIGSVTQDPEIENLFIYNTTRALVLSSSATITLRNVFVRNSTYAFLQPPHLGLNHYIINGDMNTWEFSTPAGGTGGEIWRQYEFDLNITDSANSPIQNANVTVSHYGQGETQDFSILTSSNGSFSTQTLTMGFYNQTAGNTLYDYNPYSITITHDDFATKTFNFTLDSQIEWQIVLEEDEFASGIGAGFILAFMICLVFGLAGLYVKKKRS